MSEHTPPLAYVDTVTHEPCPTRPNVGSGMILCTSTDPSHRHMASHMVPRLTLTVVAGEKPWSVLSAIEALGREEPRDE